MAFNSKKGERAKSIWYVSKAPARESHSRDLYRRPTFVLLRVYSRALFQMNVCHLTTRLEERKMIETNEKIVPQFQNDSFRLISAASAEKALLALAAKRSYGIRIDTAAEDVDCAGSGGG